MNARFTDLVYYPIKLAVFSLAAKADIKSINPE